MIGDGWSGRHPHLPEHGGTRRIPRARSDRLYAAGFGVAADTAYTVYPGRGPKSAGKDGTGPAAEEGLSARVGGCGAPVEIADQIAGNSRTTLMRYEGQILSYDMTSELSGFCGKCQLE